MHRGSINKCHINWYLKQQGSPCTVLTSLSEIYRLENYMYIHKISRLANINSNILCEYLTRYSLRNKARKYYALKSLLVYYRKYLNNYYEIPKLEFNVQKNNTSSISTGMITKLFEHISNNSFDLFACGILFILELGINYHELKTISKQSNYLLFYKSSNNRTETYQVQVNINELSEILQNNLTFIQNELVFQTIYSRKYNSYVSTDFLKDNIKYS